MAIFLKNSSGKFLTLNGKLLRLNTNKVSISSGGTFTMSNGDILYLDPTTLGGDITFSTESGDGTVAFLENIDADTIYESGNGIFYDYTYFDNSVWELRVYPVEFYEILNSGILGEEYWSMDLWEMEEAVDWYTGGAVITLRLEAGYWIQK